MNTLVLVLIIIFILILILGVVIVFWCLGTYNGFVKQRNSVEEGFSTMDVYLKKRYDLIPNLVEVVKGYAKHEGETLEKVIAARNFASNASSFEEKIEGENMIQGTLKSLFSVTESYPDLKANGNFQDLQQQLKKIEDDIANSRKYYNAVVKQYNIKIEIIPAKFIASFCKFERKPMFEITETAERENVKIQMGG